MVRENVPAEGARGKVCRAIPDHDSRKQFLGHLRDSLSHFETDGEEAAAHALQEVIELLEHMSQHPESGGRR